MSSVDEKMTNLANTIRNKAGKTNTLTLDDMAVEVATLTNTSNDTVTADTLLLGVTAHDSSGNIIVGTYEGAGTAYPSLTNPAAASQVLESKQFINGDGEVVTGTMPIISETSYRPAAHAQSIPAGHYLSGNQIIEGEENLIEENIKKDVSIFGVIGTYSAGEEDVEDGNTHIWIHLGEGRTSPILGCCPNGTVTVDWGDGTPTDTLTGTSTTIVEWTPTHNYTNPGDYQITLIVDGEVGFQDGGYGYTCALSYSKDYDNRNIIYAIAIKKVELGRGVTSIGNGAFGICYALATVVIPDSVTSIGVNAFVSCHSLADIVIPNTVTSINSGAFGDCQSLASIDIPDSVHFIGNSVFYNCIGIRYYDFSTHTTIPTLESDMVFYGMPVDCEIRVPTALYEEWRNATNWSAYANCIVAV